MIHTKIICTMGPSVNSLEKIYQLIDAGMNVARLNFSHGDHVQHLAVIEMLKEARYNRRVPLAILLDTKGPEIRLGKFKDDMAVLEKGQKWFLAKEECLGDNKRANIDPAYILDDLEPGMKVLFDDGYISSIVISKNAEGVEVEIENGGIVKTRKGVNIPNTALSLPAVTPRDVEDLKFGCENDIDIVAASFVRSASHILEVKKVLSQCGKKDTLVLAKIENNEGVQNFDAIIHVADGVMIARGDLGVEVPLSQVPRLQKMMIRKSYLAGKISVTATQMLESMIQNPRPTRAEASDVANAIYDSSSAVMLSGETAVGKYPIETVHMMRSIIEEAEKDFDYRGFFNQHSGLVYHDVPSSVTLASVKTAYNLGAKCLFNFTTGGTSSRLISRLRPSMPIIAMTPSEKCYNQLAISWGVFPFVSHNDSNVIDAFSKISSHALAENYVSYGDMAVIVAGSPFGVAGTTNTMIVENIGNVLVRGHLGSGNVVYGNIVHILDPKGHPVYLVADKIIVITQCDERYASFISVAKAVILQNHIDDLESEVHLVEMAKETGKPILLRADDAVHILKEGQLVTLDPAKAIVYKGVVL